MPNYFFHSQVDAKCSTTLFYLLLLFSWEVLSNSFGIPWTTCDKTGYCVEAKNLCEFIKILVLSVTTCVNLKNSGSFYICETEAVILRYLFLMGFELSSVVLRFFFCCYFSLSLNEYIHCLHKLHRNVRLYEFIISLLSSSQNLILKVFPFDVQLCFFSVICISIFALRLLVQLAI